MGRRNRKQGSSRRKILSKIAALSLVAGVGFSLESTRAFTTSSGSRISSINGASTGDGIVGIVPRESVQYNQREALVEFRNNHSSTLTITVSLSNTSDGTLYDNDGDSGGSVTFNLVVGGSQFVDLKAAVTGSISYDIDVTSQEFSLSTTNTVSVETGRNAGAVDIRKPHSDNHFTADPSRDRWEISNIDVRDNDGDNDLDRIEIRIREDNSDGTSVATDTITIPGGASDRYSPSGSPDARLKPDDNKYNITAGTDYSLEFVAYDADGNFTAESLDTTA